MAAAPVSDSLRRLGASLLALGRIRIELFALELQEEKERLAALLFWAVLTALLAGFGLVFVALCLTVAFWDDHRVAALASFAALFLAGFGVGLLRLRRLVSQEGAPFGASLEELRADEAGLRSRDTP
ncbi:MAG: phage holin family protein [Piscinibacter sp.]|nr:phage holin family protein [Piscinibacter sp.]